MGPQVSLPVLQYRVHGLHPGRVHGAQLVGKGDGFLQTCHGLSTAEVHKRQALQVLDHLSGEAATSLGVWGDGEGRDGGFVSQGEPGPLRRPLCPPPTALPSSPRTPSLSLRTYLRGKASAPARSGPQA